MHATLFQSEPLFEKNWITLTWILRHFGEKDKESTDTLAKRSANVNRTVMP